MIAPTTNSPTLNTEGTRNESQPLLALKHILVPVDFSQTSLKALSYALPFAKQFGAKITLLNVIPTPVYFPEVPYSLPTAEEAVGTVTAELTKLANEQIPAEIEKEILVKTGIAFDSIIQTAAEKEVDLIIVTTHGYTGLKHVLIGSTAERVVRSAPCPVLVVRVHEHDFV